MIQPTAAARVSVPVSSTDTDSLAPEYSMTARRIASSTTVITSGSTARPFWSTVFT